MIENTKVKVGKWKESTKGKEVRMIENTRGKVGKEEIESTKGRGDYLG